MKVFLFLVVILLANIMQGITGFAGTILAMPPGLMLTGYNVAKPILNVLGIFAGIYVLASPGGSRKEKRDYVNDRDKQHIAAGRGWRHVDRKLLGKIIVVMAPAIVVGILLKAVLAEHEEILYRCLGVFVAFIAVQGLCRMFKTLKRGSKNRKEIMQKEDGVREVGQKEEGIRGIGQKEDSIRGTVQDKEHVDKIVQKKASEGLTGYVLLVLAGIVHGMFVSGGPLLIGFMSKEARDKRVFRSTISTVWLILNTVILLDDMRMGLWNIELIKIQLMAIPFLFAGMFVGSRLYDRMSQKMFMIITYSLLLISGVSLLVK